MAEAIFEREWIIAVGEHGDERMSDDLRIFLAEAICKTEISEKRDGF